MPLTAKEKQELYRDRYDQFVYLILKYQDVFENFIAPKLNEKEIDQFFEFFDKKISIKKGKEGIEIQEINYNEIMNWIESNKKRYFNRIIKEE